MPSNRSKTLACALSLLAAAACGQGQNDRAEAERLAASATSRPARAADPAAPGPFAAGFRYLVLEDASRTDDGGAVREIPVHLWYPVDPEALGPGTPEAVYPLDPIYAPGHAATSTEAEVHGVDRAWDAAPSGGGPFPLVLLSPGWSMDPTFYAFYGARLASHGFVIAGLTHAGDGDFATASGVPPAKVMFDRPRDLSFVATRLIEEAGPGRGRRHGLVDPLAVAAMGHSIGGYAALALAGGDDDACDAINEAFGDDYSGPWCAGVTPDPRVRAVVRLDASEWALRWDELARVRVPTITLNTDADSYAPFCPGANARGHAAISSGVNLRVDAVRSNHQSFTLLCDWVRLYQAKGILHEATVEFWNEMFCSDPDPGNGGFARVDPHGVSAATSRTIVAFLKTHLAHEPGFAGYLTAHWVWSREPGLELFRTEVGGESHYGPESPCSLTVSRDDEFDFYWHMPAPRGNRSGPAPL